MSSGFGAGLGADMLQDIIRQKVVEAYKQQELQQQQQRIEQENRRLKMQDADRAAAMNDLARSRGIQNAGRVAGTLKIGQTISQPTVEALKAGEMGDLVQHDAADLPSRAISGMANAGAKAPSMGPLRIVGAGRPERDTFTGTAEQVANEQARQDNLRTRAEAAQAKVDAAKQAAIDRADLAKQNAEARADLARLTAGLHGGNADLQRQILQDKIDTAHDKETEKKQAADNARNAALASIDDTSAALDELIDEKGNLKPGAAGAFGADSMLGIIPGTSYADARARRDRLQSRLTIDLLGEMKRQSRTGASGFGALSEKELAVLQNAAARLGQSQSDESARQALVDVRKQLAGMRSRAAGAAPSAPPAPPDSDAAARAAALIKKYGGG